jgi:hypothetical protein
MFTCNLALVGVFAAVVGSTALAQPSLTLQPLVGTGKRSSAGNITQVSGAEVVAAVYRLTSNTGEFEFSPLLEVANVFVSGRLDEDLARQSSHFDIKSVGMGAHFGLQLSNKWLTQLAVSGGRGWASLQSDQRTTSTFTQTTFRSLDELYGKVRIGGAYKAKENIRLVASLGGTFAKIDQSGVTGQTKGEETRDGNIYLTSSETPSADVLANNETLKLYTIQIGVEALLP